MQRFEITLKNEKIRLYNRLSWLIISINILVFIYFSFFSAEKKIRIACIAALTLLIICFFLWYFLRNTKWQPGHHIFFLFLLVGWIAMEKYWLGAVPFIFDLLSAIAVRKLVAVFSKDKISYPSFPPKIINWSKLNNAVLKDGLLTIDLKNNKLMQQFIDEKSSVIDEKEFNDFCNEQLNKARLLTTPD